MKRLATAFKSNGYDFKQIDRIGQIALFQKTKAGHSGLSEHYEVVVIQQHAARTIAGVLIEAGEAMPSSETWGTCGFTFSDLPSARKKFNELA